jgi:hypothetical protein
LKNFNKPLDNSYSKYFIKRDRSEILRPFEAQGLTINEGIAVYLHRKAKSKAALAGIPRKDLFIKAVEDYCINYCVRLRGFRRKPLALWIDPGYWVFVDFIPDAFLNIQHQVSSIPA